MTTTAFECNIGQAKLITLGGVHEFEYYSSPKLQHAKNRIHIITLK